MNEAGGGTSRPPDISLRELDLRFASLEKLVNERFSALETIYTERRESDQRAVQVAKATADTAVKVAKETSDAALLSHNGLIKKMEDQAAESGRQLQRLTDTYATKENLEALETLIGQRLVSIDGKLVAIEASAGVVVAQRLTARGVWSDLRSTIVFGFVVLAGVITLITYFAQN